MKRTSSMAFFQESDKRVTRAQINFVKSIFPFLHLPGELREMVYIESFPSLKGIEKFFDKLYPFIKTQGKDSRMTKAVQRATPNVLLICRQIFNEAIDTMRKGYHTATFHHGLLNVKLPRVIKAFPLRQLSSIEINDSGHRLLEKLILSNSWHGYMRLMRDVAEILEKGHNLKSFTVRFTDPKLVEHVTLCAHGTWDCGFRDQLREACDSLRKVRGIKEVNFFGIEADQARELKRRMQSKSVTTFFSLPKEIRNKIYDYAIDYSDISNSIAKVISQRQNPNDDFAYPATRVPNILRINKQIAREALTVLRQKPLNLDFPAEGAVPFEWKLPRFLRFIKCRSLLRISTINITLNHWKWAWVIINALEYVLRESPVLKNLTITVNDSQKRALIQFPRGNLLPLPLHHDFLGNPATRNLLHLGVEGDIPANFLEPLIHIFVFNSQLREWHSDLPAETDTEIGALYYGYDHIHELESLRLEENENEDESMAED